MDLGKILPPGRRRWSRRRFDPAAAATVDSEASSGDVDVRSR
jgi:hypothetical protein